MESQLMAQLTTQRTIPDDERDCDTDAIHPAAVMNARRAIGDAPEPGGVATIFAILGDPTRIRVRTALSTGELCVCDLAAATGVNRSTVSHQLRVLRDHRLVRRRREGKVVYYALDDDHVLQLLAVAGAHSSEDIAEGEEATA
jgi:ArsR family transcriptional regulator